MTEARNSALACWSAGPRFEPRSGSQIIKLLGVKSAWPFALWRSFASYLPVAAWLASNVAAMPVPFRRGPRRMAAAVSGLARIPAARLRLARVWRANPQDGRAPQPDPRRNRVAVDLLGQRHGENIATSGARVCPLATPFRPRATTTAGRAASMRPRNAAPLLDARRFEIRCLRESGKERTFFPPHRPHDCGGHRRPAPPPAAVALS